MWCGGWPNSRRLLHGNPKGPHLLDEVLEQEDGRRQVLALASGVGVDSWIYFSELRAPELDLTLRRGVAVHAGVQPEVRQVIARLLVDGPRTEAELLEPLIEVSEKSARPMQSVHRQVDIPMAAAGHGCLSCKVEIGMQFETACDVDRSDNYTQQFDVTCLVYATTMRQH